MLIPLQGVRQIEHSAFSGVFTTMVNEEECKG